MQPWVQHLIMRTMHFVLSAAVNNLKILNGKITTTSMTVCQTGKWLPEIRVWISSKWEASVSLNSSRSSEVSFKRHSSQSTQASMHEEYSPSTEAQWTMSCPSCISWTFLGLDRIHPRVLRKFVGVTAGPISTIYQRSWDSEDVPADPGNYRPVSSTSVTGKFVEKIILCATEMHLNH